MVKHAKLLMMSNKVDTICFLETKTNNAVKLLNMTSNLGFILNHVVDSIGFANGLILVWNPTNVTLQIATSTSRSHMSH